MKTIKQLLITLAVLLCSATASAYDFEVDGIYYKVLSMSGLTVEVTSGDNKYSGEVIIPSTVSYKSKTLTVTSIGYYAFSDCSGLTSIEIPNSVTSIGYNAFSDCSGLTSITIPNSVTSIRSCAFYNCSGLKSVVIPNSVTSIEESAFRDCTKLRSITIPNSVTSISSMVFYGCSGLTSVVIPNSVTSIGESAFYNCDILFTVINLSNLTLTRGSREYGFVAYYANNVIHIPNGDIVDDFIFSTSDNKHTLVKYFGIKNVIILPEDYNGDSYAIGDYAFKICGGLTSIEIPNSVTSIGESAFNGCSGLTSITIPNSVTSIGESAFNGCSGLTSITIGNSVTSIGKSAFQYCTKLRSITIPNSVTSISSMVFYGCSGLTSVVIPNSVTSIGEGAFYNCDSLASIRLLGETPPTVGSNSFTNKQYLNTIVYVPKGTLATYQAADTWKNFWDIREEDTTETPEEEVKKCATPLITYNNSGLDIASETDGSEIHTDITCSDANSYNGDRIDLSATYSITTYATKSGYLNSDTATATLCWIAVNGSSEENGIIEVEAMPVLITCNNGTINISGGKDGAEVVVYTTSGVAVGNATITNGNATISTELAMGEIAVVNIAGKGIKIVMQ